MSEVQEVASVRPGSRLFDPLQPLFNIIFLYAFNPSERLALAIWEKSLVIASAAGDEKRPTLQSTFEAAIRNSWHPIVDSIINYAYKSRTGLNYNYGLREAARLGDTRMMRHMESWGATDLHSAFNAAAHAGQVPALRLLWTGSGKLPTTWSMSSSSSVDCVQAMRLAASVGNIPAVEFLLTCGPSRCFNSHVDNALMVAARRGRKDLVAFLLDREPTCHWPAADAAIEAGHEDIATQIMQRWDAVGVALESTE
jgi:hypothetical protein